MGYKDTTRKPVKRYRPKKGKTVSWNFVREQTCKPGNYDDWSAYWEYLDHSANVLGNRSNDGANELIEPATANPDMLGDTALERRNDQKEIAELKIQAIMENAREILSRQEYQVIQLLMGGYSLIEAATRLKISQPSVSIYLKRARKKLTKLLQDECL